MAGPDSITYEVYTDLPPEQLSEAGLEIYRLWLSFALGETSLRAQRLKSPTGRYAGSLRYREYGNARVAIIADERIAPEAGILETGHGAVDLKTKLTQGRAYPMHRGVGRSVGAARGPGAKRIWARAKRGGFSGFASVGKTGWIIPEMKAYEPARILAELLAQQYGR